MQNSLSICFKYAFQYFLIVYLGFTAFTAHAEEIYTWSVVPQFTGIAVHRDWTPVLEAIEKDTGHRIKLKLYESIPQFEAGFTDGRPDFAYMNPYHAVMANKTQGYRPIIRDGKRKLTGILVVRNDSTIKSVQDLKGARIAFPSPNAFAAALYMRALLAEKEGITFTPVYAKTHSNSYRFVLHGKTLASGGVYRTLRRERPEVQSELEVIYKSPGTPTHPIVVHKRVPKEVAVAVQKSILRLTNTIKGKLMLKAILIPDPITADYTRDYQPLQKLRLEKYIVMPAKKK